MDSAPTRPPVMSTPDTRLAEATVSTVAEPLTASEEEIDRVYEIKRTVDEIRLGAWKRVALQFPDDLLPDAPRIYRRLRECLRAIEGSLDQTSAHDRPAVTKGEIQPLIQAPPEVTLFVLGDTSYSACCIDEIAAEHIDADVVVHYGRACLSPPARLPTIHVFTIQPLDHDRVVEAIKGVYSDVKQRIILSADMPYISHLPALAGELKAEGYENIFQTEIRHDPLSLLPNRTVPAEAAGNDDILKEWSLFHVSEPPQALLLTLASRVSSVYFYPTGGNNEATQALEASTKLALRRRYGLVTRLSRASIIGILVNTLSIHAYQAALEGTQARIAAVGKKSYVFAMGRLNSAKIANFAEVDGWVVLGCWESSLIENAEFDKPVVAPFELELALQSDHERIWSGAWRGDFSNMTKELTQRDGDDKNGFADASNISPSENPPADGWQLLQSDSESEPPEFDLRTGRYIMSSNPIRDQKSSPAKVAERDGKNNALAHRAKADLALIGGELSPGAQYLRDKRTWRGLGSDFEIAYEEEKDTTAVKEGRSGIARGYENEKPAK